MNNNPTCNKRCLECFHCEPRCIQSCRDCHRCNTFMIDRVGSNHPVPRDMFLLTRNNEDIYSNSPRPMYCKTKKCIKYESIENAKTIMNSDVSLCYFCKPNEINKNRLIFPPDIKKQGVLFLSERNGETAPSNL